MDQALGIFFSWQFILFSFGVYVITLLIRKFVEYFLDKPSVPANKTSKIWKELFLPTMPIFLGLALGALLKQFPYPDGITSETGRVFFGLIGGFFSAKMYRIINAFIKSKLPDNLQKELDDGDISATEQPKELQPSNDGYTQNNQ